MIVVGMSKIGRYSESRVKSDKAISCSRRYFAETMRKVIMMLVNL